MESNRKPAADSRAVEILKCYSKEKSARSNVDNSYRDIERLVLPSFEGSNTDERKSVGTDTRPVSSVATSDAILLGSNLYSYSYSNSDRNFMLRAARKDDSESMKVWLQHATDTATRFMQSSNFAQAYGEFCRAWSNFGTGTVGTEYDTDKQRLIFTNVNIVSNVYVTEDANGNVNSIKRLLQFTALDAVKLFGAQGLCEGAKKALVDMSKANDKFEYVLSVSENPKYNPERFDIGSAKYISEYVCKKDKRIVKSSGYRSWPYPTSRFIKPLDGSPYGIGACHMALPAIREINRSEAQIVDAFEMMAHPPIIVTDDEQLEISEVVPNSVLNTKGNVEHFNINTNPQVIQARIDQLSSEIKRQFFTNVFLAVMTSEGSKTATEVNALQSEQFASISPMISRLRSEFWTPMIERVIELLMDAGEIEQPEGEIIGKDFEISYISQIDTRMEMMDLQKQTQGLGSVTQFIQALKENPELARYVKADPMITDMLEKFNVPYDFIVSDYERKAMDEQAAEMQAAQAAQEQAQFQAEQTAPVDTSKAPEDGSPMQLQMDAAMAQSE